MRLHRHTWMFLCCALPPLVVGCGPADDSGTPESPAATALLEGQPLPGTAALDGEIATRMLIGELRSVDPDRGTLLVGTSDGTFEVVYTEATEVVGGASNVQGLAPQTGSRVTVYYRTTADGRIAVRIETQ